MAAMGWTCGRAVLVLFNIITGMTFAIPMAAVYGRWWPWLYQADGPRCGLPPRSASFPLASPPMTG
jgi:hypothetical protein